MTLTKKQIIINGPMFSYNTPKGMCQRCHGTGYMNDFSIDLIVPEPSKPIQNQPWGKDATTIFQYVSIFFEPLAETYGYDFNTPFEKLTKQQQHTLLYGTNGVQIKRHDKKKGSILSYVYHGIIPHLQKAYQTNKMESRIKSIESYMKQGICLECNGERFRSELRSVTFIDLTIMEWFSTEISILEKKCEKELINYEVNSIGYLALSQLFERLKSLNNIGLGYLTLGRPASTLSGGERHHIQLTSYINSRLSGILFILDEPTSSLHEKDRAAIINVIQNMINADNSVIVIDYNRMMIENANYVVDFGPGGGKDGGYICFSGPMVDFIKANTLTAQYLRNEKVIETTTRKKNSSNTLKFKNINFNNIRNLNIAIPTKQFVTIVGVTGSGKSSLMESINTLLNKKDSEDTQQDSITVLGEVLNPELIDDVVHIDQSPIGRMSRSNLATYSGAFDEIRKLYASLDQAKEAGITANMLSFNTEGGRCDTCVGMGIVSRNVYFLHEVYSTCPTCQGHRYKDFVLQLTYKEKNISQVLDMTVTEALTHFTDHKKISTILHNLENIGLGYMTLGQSTVTLSGGEAQRLKLGKHLSQKTTGHTLFLFDEPTVGLHFENIRQLVSVFQNLVDQGNSIICIEHNIDVIKLSDYIIEMGPNGGGHGGSVVCEGTLDEVIANPASITGPYLKR